MAKVRYLVVATALPVLLGLGDVAAADPGQARAVDVLRVDFDYVSGPDGQPVTTVQVSGAASVSADVATRNGGQLVAATGRTGSGRAVRMPAFGAADSTPRAVVRVVNAGSRDQLSPGNRDFSFGADFVLDAVSSQTGSSDDGDNLVQRGRFDDPDQYKLQIDSRRPSCRLMGTTGSSAVDLLVTSSVVVDSTHWYTATCVRTGSTLQVVVSKINSDGTTTTTTTTKRSQGVINISMPAKSTALSIGGKLDADGSVSTDSDQFNGLVDNVLVQVP